MGPACLPAFSSFALQSGRFQRTGDGWQCDRSSFQKAKLGPPPFPGDSARGSHNAVISFCSTSASNSPLNVAAGVIVGEFCEAVLAFSFGCLNPLCKYKP